MCEAFDSGLACLTRYPLGRLDMYGMKGLLSAFDVKTDRIYHTVSAGKCIGDRPIVVDISLDRLKLRIIEPNSFLPRSDAGMRSVRNSRLRRCQSTRRPRNPVPPNTVIAR